MITKKRGLGRGLDVLLGQTESVGETVGRDGEMRQLPIELIRPGRYQPRKEMDREALEDLASSIKTQGVIQPILVRAVDVDSYEIIAGERRWRASQLAGFEQIPVIIRDVSDEASVAMSLIENIQREDLNPMEEARALKRLLDEFELTHQQVAHAVGKSRTTVTNFLRLTSLNTDVSRMLEHGDLEMGHARALLSLADDQQKKAAAEVTRKHLNVRQAEALVQRMLHPRASKEQQQQQDRETRILEERISEKIGQPVSIRHSSKGKGKLIISYNSLDELDGVLEHLTAKESL
ncbi:MAG: ParB/RepB/Spo0J family partition protein [Gammaproteobacteria bacterium]|nr:ParB/RepB/Spo0J family partition protein [Gammaproteobacteria bacterium]